jgi:hypothetical protein
MSAVVEVSFNKIRINSGMLYFTTIVKSTDSGILQLL